MKDIILDIHYKFLEFDSLIKSPYTERIQKFCRSMNCEYYFMREKLFFKDKNVYKVEYEFERSSYGPWNTDAFCRFVGFSL